MLIDFSTKTAEVYVKFFFNAACQKLLKSANVSRSYWKKWHVFMDRGVEGNSVFAQFNCQRQ